MKHEDHPPPFGCFVAERGARRRPDDCRQDPVARFSVARGRRNGCTAARLARRRRRTARRAARATGGPDGTDFTTEPTTPRLVWTAITSGHHTATGPNDETASIHPAPATAPRDGFVYSANAAHTRRLTTGTAGTVNEAKRLCQQAVTKDHARKVDAGLRDARGVRSADGAHEIAWRAVPGGRHLGSDSTYGTTALVKPIPTASSLAWTLKGAAGGQLAAGIAPDVHQAKRATERAHDSAYGVRKRLARG